MNSMSRTLLTNLILFGSSLVFCHCTHTQPSGSSPNIVQQRDLVPVNKYLVKKSEQNIANFVHRRGWEMKETSTGLWFMIYKHGSGKMAVKGKAISFSYSLSLLDGTKCYSSDSLGIKSFRIGSGHVESGLEEAALLLREGDMARIIIPPHLAYGMLGDNNKIPGQSSILYDLMVLEIK